MTHALIKIGQRFADAGVMERAEDIFWLEWQEMIGLVLAAGDRRALIAERKRDSGLHYSVTMPDGMGSDLPVEAPRMYLLADILQLLDGELAQDKVLNMKQMPQVKAELDSKKVSR